jgi:DNA-binding MarR family transcriptional regulator
VAGTAERSMPTQEQLQIWRDYVETAEAIRLLIAGRLLSETGLSSGDYVVLLALNEAADRNLRSSELADQIGWERSRLSHHLGRMEKRGLIQRTACADDNRGAEIALTDDGARVFRAGSVPHLKAVREIFIDAFDSSQLAQIDALTTSLRTHLGFDVRN